MAHIFIPPQVVAFQLLSCLFLLFFRTFRQADLCLCCTCQNSIFSIKSSNNTEFLYTVFNIVSVLCAYFIKILIF